jgi:PRTRC genetic system ThiF family protein
MKTIHCIHPRLLNPSEAVSVNLIGAGGTGSTMLTVLARLNYALLQLDHPGLHVHVWDDDLVSPANLGRQLFAASELGLSKAAALVNRVNRTFGFNWKAVEERYTPVLTEIAEEHHIATLTISCVDTAQARFDIAHVLGFYGKHARYHRDCPTYWMDCGNEQHTGQLILSTVRPVHQPTSKKFKAVDYLPPVTVEFGRELRSKSRHDSPSCSLAEALTKQSLFINSAIAQLAGALLDQLFRDGVLLYRGFFIDLLNFRSQPLALPKPKAITAKKKMAA